MKLFNTVTGKKEELQKNPGGRFLIYLCGPTVYNYAHIGNFRTYLLQDVLIRTLETKGYDPLVVRNITDVDDKTIHASLKEGISLRKFTDKWIKIFHEDCSKLNIKPPDFEPRATEHIPEQIDMIKNLILKGFAYISSDGSVYFKVSAFKNYGKLSKLEKCHLQTQKLNSSKQKNLADEYDREHVADFALWKIAKPADGEIFWESPWGKGRPGWHIECSAMAKKYLGDTIDLHSGGIDLKFPHHENEIAQSECFNGKIFSKHWMHIAHLLVDGAKMSKSLGNLYTLSDIMAKSFSPQCLRCAMIASHYSQQLNFTENNLVSAQNALNKLQKFYEMICDEYQDDQKSSEQGWKFFGHAFDALTDDLNTPACIGNIFKVVNEYISHPVPAENKSNLRREFLRIAYCLGLEFDKNRSEIPPKIKELANARWKAKQNGKYSAADSLRQEIAKYGWKINDLKGGYTIEKSHTSEL